MTAEQPVTRASGVVRRVCVVGAGSPGIAAGQALHRRGMRYAAFPMPDGPRYPEPAFPGRSPSL